MFTRLVGTRYLSQTMGKPVPQPCDVSRSSLVKTSQFTWPRPNSLGSSWSKASGSPGPITRVQPNRFNPSHLAISCNESCQDTGSTQLPRHHDDHNTVLPCQHVPHHLSEDYAKPAARALECQGITTQSVPHQRRKV